MTGVDARSRSYLVVEIAGDARTEVVASLLEKAAGELRRYGEIVVHDVSLETSDLATHATTALTVYYERIERRRFDRS